MTESKKKTTAKKSLPIRFSAEEKKHLDAVLGKRGHKYQSLIGGFLRWYEKTGRTPWLEADDAFAIPHHGAVQPVNKSPAPVPSTPPAAIQGHAELIASLDALTEKLAAAKADTEKITDRIKQEGIVSENENESDPSKEDRDQSVVDHDPPAEGKRVARGVLRKLALLAGGAEEGLRDADGTAGGAGKNAGGF